MKKPKHPDRWERIVETEWWGENGNVVAALLRREHRAVVRMVRGERWCSEDSYYAKVYNQAIDAVLAKLKARGK